MRIAMIGSGYVGLVSGACFAASGHQVCCIDNDPAKVAALKAGRVPIFEPGLDQMISDNVAAGRLSFTESLAEALEGADAAFIGVGTPSRPDDGHADLSFVYSAAREIAELAQGQLLIVTKSTVPVGTGDEIERIAVDVNGEAEISVVSNPEFLKEGDAIADFMNPDRIVIGVEDARAVKVMRAIYQPLTDAGAPLLVMDRRGAELTKYAANALLATKITFINEMANLCEAVGTDVSQIARGIGMDRRIGARFLDAGPGYGGSCFPKDTLALVKTAQDYGAPQRVVETVISVNEQRKQAMGWRVVAALGEPRGKVVGILGLTFKAKTDDMRDSPALSIINVLKEAGAGIRVYDPEGMGHARGILPDVTFCADAYEAADGADAVVIATEWEQFAGLDLAQIRQTMRGRLLIDLRNLYDPDKLDAAGFNQVGVGRPPRMSSNHSDRFPTGMAKPSTVAA